MRVDPIPVAVLTPPEQMMGEAMQQAGNKGGPAALLPALDRILAKYPEYSDGYVRMPARAVSSVCSPEPERPNAFGRSATPTSFPALPACRTCYARSSDP
jgi:hypothetical protein